MSKYLGLVRKMLGYGQAEPEPQLDLKAEPTPEQPTSRLQLEKIHVTGRRIDAEALDTFGVTVLGLRRHWSYDCIQNVDLVLPEDWSVVRLSEALREIRDGRNRMRAEIYGAGDERGGLYVRSFYRIVHNYSDPTVVAGRIEDANGRIYHEFSIPGGQAGDGLIASLEWFKKRGIDYYYDLTGYWD